MYFLTALMLFSAQPEAVVIPEVCETIETTISGKSMQGILFNGQKITVYTTACGEAELYDHLLFTHKETPNAVVKTMWGRPGDILEVLPNGYFNVNGVRAKTPFGRNYKLLGAHKTRFKKIQAKGPLDGYLVLGHPGSLDSARMGLIPEEDILGYVKKDQPYVEKE